MGARWKGGYQRGTEICIMADALVTDVERDYREFLDFWEEVYVDDIVFTGLIVARPPNVEKFSFIMSFNFAIIISLTINIILS